MGFEPTNRGATILCLNHLATTAVVVYLSIPFRLQIGNCVTPPQQDTDRAQDENSGKSNSQGAIGIVKLHNATIKFRHIGFPNSDNY